MKSIQIARVLTCRIFFFLFYLSPSHPLYPLFFLGGGGLGGDSRTLEVLMFLNLRRKSKILNQFEQTKANHSALLAACIHASELSSYCSSTFALAMDLEKTPDSNNVNNFNEQRTLLTSNTITFRVYSCLLRSLRSFIGG